MPSSPRTGSTDTLGSVPMETRLRVVVVSGMSGAGKSTALRALEDFGFFCVDNMPLPLVPQFIELADTRPDIVRVALGIDARGHAFGRGAGGLASELRSAGHRVSVFFFDASDETLVRRFSESRRPHPLAPEEDTLTGIQREREALSQLRAQADEVIDSSHLTVHQLRSSLATMLPSDTDVGEMVIRLMSFGFRYGIPVDADLVVDVRFLPNPYYEPDLKPLAGTDKAVSDFILSKPQSVDFLQRYSELLSTLLSHYRREGKSYLTVALGCTGGRHRSVALVEALARRLDLPHNATVMHRDVDRGKGERMATRDGSI